MSTQTLTQRRTAEADAVPAVPAKQLISPDGVLVTRVPASKPAFTIGDIRRAIPAHCFERPLWKSFGYTAINLAVVAALYLATETIAYASDDLLGSTAGPIVRGALWVAYWIAQGSVSTGIWVIGHECGHYAFADSQLINDVVGLILHSALLVPYFAWQISHRRHHSNTGSVEHDEVFVPTLATPEQVAQQRSGHHDEVGYWEQTMSTLSRMWYIFVMLVFGWPGYLISNISGNKSYDPSAWVNHFAPTSPIYTTGSELDAYNQKLILISDVALIGVVSLLVKFASVYGFAHFFFTWFMPYLVVNHFLVLITYLQHTDLFLPHYTDGEWDWLRGALATVDRDYGILNTVFHRITDTHVLHHLFSYMPFYHAAEATEAIKPIIGDYYRKDSTPIGVALWRCFRDCDLLYPDEKLGGVHWFEPKPQTTKQQQ